jgi:anti-sigma factor RsiW
VRSMDCNELVELVTAYLDDALDAQTRASFEEHLLDCDGCGNYLEQFRVTIATVGTIGSEDLDADYRSRLIETFRDWRSSPPATPERGQ